MVLRKIIRVIPLGCTLLRSDKGRKIAIWHLVWLKCNLHYFVIAELR